MLPEYYSQSIRDLVDYCLILDQTMRPNIEKVLRYPIVRAELDHILKDLIPLTYEYPTALSTHLVLEQVIEIQCMLAESTDDYGLTLTDESLLIVANTPDSQFLLQAELRAIHQRLQYIERKNPDGDIYTGYVNQDGEKEGVGIGISTNGFKYIGEWHLNKSHGCGKGEDPSGATFWGELMEGYGTEEGASGDRYIG
jgi:hypothetical protein